MVVYKTGCWRDSALLFDVFRRDRIREGCQGASESGQESLECRYNEAKQGTWIRGAMVVFGEVSIRKIQYFLASARRVEPRNQIFSIMTLSWNSAPFGISIEE